MTELLGLHPDIINTQGTIQLFLRLCIDLFFTGFVVLGCYIRKHGKNEYIFTYIMFNVITFTLCYTLRQVPIELGFALGLFAIFGILRYRTEPIRIHNLTYLFVVIGLGILNAVVNEKISLGEVLLSNMLITGLILFIERLQWFSYGRELKITYPVIPQQDRANLLEDLRSQTGLPIESYRIESVDVIRKITKITVVIPRRRD